MSLDIWQKERLRRLAVRALGGLFAILVIDDATNMLAFRNFLTASNALFLGCMAGLSIYMLITGKITL